MRTVAARAMKDRDLIEKSKKITFLRNFLGDCERHNLIPTFDIGFR